MRVNKAPSGNKMLMDQIPDLEAQARTYKLVAANSGSPPPRPEA